MVDGEGLLGHRPAQDGLSRPRQRDYVRRLAFARIAEGGKIGPNQISGDPVAFRVALTDCLLHLRSKPRIHPPLNEASGEQVKHGTNNFHRALPPARVDKTVRTELGAKTKRFTRRVAACMTSGRRRFTTSAGIAGIVDGSRPVKAIILSINC